MPIPSPKKGESKDAFTARCMGSDTMKKEFPDNDQRIAVCLSQWRKKDNMHFFTSQLKANVSFSTMNGVEHLVVPVIALVEGVVWPSNAPAPELALASEFGNVAQGWDGRPVLIGHPVRNGTQVSANSPDVWDSEVIGQLFNSKIEDNKLKTEAWINLTRVEELGGDVSEIVELLKAGEIVEVSTGLFADIEERKGIFNGEEFNGVWTNVVPDHLAILPLGTIGACSIEDGCGTNRVNKRTCGCENPKECKCDMDPEKLTLADLDIRIPVTAEEFVEQAFDTSIEAAERTFARHSAYKIMCKEGVFSRWLSSIRGSLSDIDRRIALDAALSEKEEFFFINAVEDSFFVYEQGWQGALLSQNYRIEDDGTIVLVGEPSRVRPETNFLPVSTKHEEDDMDKEKRVNALIANSSTKFDASHKDWLMTLEEAQLEALEPAPAPTPEPKAPQTVDEYLAAAPAGIREVLNSGRALLAEQRENLTARIKANKANEFTDEELARMPIESLKRLAALAHREEDDYIGLGGPRFNEEDPLYAPQPRQLFSKKKEA